MHKFYVVIGLLALMALTTAGFAVELGADAGIGRWQAGGSGAQGAPGA